jgi:hypothetical protein
MSQNRSMLRSLWRMITGQQDLRASHVVLERASEVVRTHPGDAEALAELRGVVGAEPGGARALLERFADSRETARTDRIYRLVRAALDDAPVAAVNPERAALFARLEALVQMPIGDAFRQLAEREPALDRLAATVDPFPTAAPVDGDEALGWLMKQHRRAAKLVGPRAGHADAVLRTHRMLQLVTAYLRIAAGDASCGDATTSYDDWHRNELDARVRAGTAEVTYDERTGMTRVSVGGEIGFGPRPRRRR